MAVATAMAWALRVPISTPTATIAAAFGQLAAVEVAGSILN
jgi:hypothetical protein